MKTPIDVVLIYYAAALNDFDLLIVDSFQELNGASTNEIDAGKRRLHSVIQALDKLYGRSVPVDFSSRFMSTKHYQTVFDTVREQIEERGLEKEVQQTVPLSKRTCEQAKTYPIHELAVMQFLANDGYQTKVGPTAERKYDAIGEKLDIPLQYAYLVDSVSVATPNPEVVVPYIPTTQSGQRLCIGAKPRSVRSQGKPKL